MDWTPVADDLEMFCAVLAWSRYRFVRFARDQQQATTLALLAECFEELGGVPATVLTDRMGCLKGGVVANQVGPDSPSAIALPMHLTGADGVSGAGDPNEHGSGIRTAHGLRRLTRTQPPAHRFAGMAFGTHPDRPVTRGSVRSGWLSSQIADQGPTQGDVAGRTGMGGGRFRLREG
ncbi:MAG TPA: hypothetical protein VMW80_00035 [Candidatus Dormibacteraeota bacterium]|nr:hypothetical protein [Candidatus Dormibacteraeota bacterium]